MQAQLIMNPQWIDIEDRLHRTLAPLQAARRGIASSFTITRVRLVDGAMRTNIEENIVAEEDPMDIDG